MKNIHLVSHTHWDREWYKPFQYFRTKLVYMIDGLLEMLDDNPDFSSFLLDGQTVVIDDYLKIKPENEDRLRKMIDSGRIIVGPWYIQPDEFAPDAESLVRNLQTGIRTARSFGRSMMTGYLPDSFGQSPQMPQILRGFGIDSAVVMRGIDFDSIGSTEFRWKGLDGSEVLGIYLMKGYSNAMFLSENNTVNRMRIKKLAKELDSAASGEHLLIMNGIDHAFAQRQAASLCSDKGWTQGSLEEYIGILKEEHLALPTLSGELISPRHHRVHTSIASTRIYQKAENRRLSIQLERQLEPLCVMTDLAGAEYPSGLIDEAWKTLILNQTHDGICGCCTDEVHRELDQRFTAAGQISETLIKNHSRALSSRLGDGAMGLTVFNTAMRQGEQLIEAEVIADDGFILIDEDGREVETQIISSEEIDVSKKSIWTLYLGTPQPAKKLRFIFNCEFKEVFAYRYFKIKPAPLISRVKPQSGAEGAAGFENEFYRMSIAPDGCLTVVDKENGESYDGLGSFEDIGEGGDTYNHSPLDNDSPIYSRRTAAAVKMIENGSHRTVFRIAQNLQIPASLSADGKIRSSDTIAMELVTQVFCYRGSRRIDFCVAFDNKAFSHRLRVLFPFGSTAQASCAETQFGTVQRSIETPESGDDWPEKPLPIYSMQRFAGLKEGRRSLFVLNRGLTEYEVYQSGESTLALTLHRGVSMMGKPNLPVRPGRASGIEVPTPDAESIGSIVREYSLIVGGSQQLNDISYHADCYASPPLAVQSRLILDKIMKGAKDFFKYLSLDNLQSIIAGSLDNAGPGSRGFIRLGSSGLSVSAVRKAMDGDGIILRLYNPGEKSVTGESLQILFPHSGLSIVNLMEEKLPEEELTAVDLKQPDGGDFLLPEIKPNTQITIKINRGI